MIHGPKFEVYAHLCCPLVNSARTSTSDLSLVGSFGGFTTISGPTHQGISHITPQRSSNFYKIPIGWNLIVQLFYSPRREIRQFGMN